MKAFIKDILVKYYGNRYETFFEKSDLFKYLDLKTSAIFGNAKTRKSLGNIYAIYSILHFYLEDGFYDNPDIYRNFDGYEFTKLLSFCRSQYGGEKIQNHALNSRLNLEFDNKTASKENKGKYIVVQNQGKYLLHIDYLYVDGEDISKAVVEIIDKYVDLLQKKDINLIERLEKLSQEQNIDVIKNDIEALLTDDSEARVFEIISYAILKNYYKNNKVFIGYSKDELEERYLTLYKTGRTNANDGGIDFVMKPLGRFFQVTEVGNYDKYFLDIEKVLHFPITFVIKTLKNKETIQDEFNSYIMKKSGGMKAIINRYEQAIEEIITINELKQWYNELNNSEIKNILNDIIQYYKIEMNFNNSFEED